MSEQEGIGIWITGIPASGKTTITKELVTQLRAYDIPVVILESDEIRSILTPEPIYQEDERNWFYQTLALLGKSISKNGVHVIFDATGNRREYRDYARSLFRRFIEVYVQCPLAVCINRDPKGIYRTAKEGKTVSVPVIQVPYEAPKHPEVVLDGRDLPEENARRIVEYMMALLKKS
ncbi:MAG: adenylyl-sulfate kinase [Nitrospirota bacterium]